MKNLEQDNCLTSLIRIVIVQRIFRFISFNNWLLLQLLLSRVTWQIMQCCHEFNIMLFVNVIGLLNYERVIHTFSTSVEMQRKSEPPLHAQPLAAQDFFSWGGGRRRGASGRATWEQVLAMEELLMNAWTITGRGSWGARPGHGGRQLPIPAASSAHAHNNRNCSPQEAHRAKTRYLLCMT